MITGESIVSDEELSNLEIKKSVDLNEEAEYVGSKQDLEKMLLDAQRYLNIFHQIHIFSDKKKAEFEQSLIDMPERIREVLLNLPGGRVLIEYIEDCEIKRGLRETRTVFESGNTSLNKIEKEENKSIISKELSQTIKDTMDAYNQDLLQINEKILENAQLITAENRNYSSQSKVIADVLRENNKQQMEIMKALGETISQAIKSSQKENADLLNKSILSMSSQNSSILENVASKINNVSENIAKKTTEISINDLQMAHKFESANNKVKNFEAENNANNGINQQKQSNPHNGVKAQPASASQPLKSPKSDNKPAANRKDDISDIDIKDLLGKDEEKNVTQSMIKNMNIKENLAQILPDKSEIAEKAASSLGSAMQKIKSAITDGNVFSRDNTGDAKVSLNEEKDDLAASFSNAFSSPDWKSSANSQPETQEWEYVDEDGNPINPDEWEYVDEDGNPINPDEWEYVDEDGNPINPKELGR